MWKLLLIIDMALGRKNMVHVNMYDYREKAGLEKSSLKFMEWGRLFNSSFTTTFLSIYPSTHSQTHTYLGVQMYIITLSPFQISVWNGFLS